MACTPKFMRRKLKLVAQVNRAGRKLGYIMHEPLWIYGLPHVAFSKKEDK